MEHLTIGWTAPGIETGSLATDRAGLERLAGALEHAARRGAGLEAIIYPQFANPLHGTVRFSVHRGPVTGPIRPDRRVTVPTRQDALRLLEEWVENPGLRNHMKAVEAAMRAYARRFGEDEERWGLAGLLHDLDWEKYPDEHPLRAVEELRRRGYPEDVLHAILAHRSDFTGVEPESQLDRALVACDEVSGLINATALVRPQGIDDLTPKSVLKKFKDAAFARGVDREEVRRGTELLGIELGEHIGNVIAAMREIADELGLDARSVSSGAAGRGGGPA